MFKHHIQSAKRKREKNSILLTSLLAHICVSLHDFFIAGMCQSGSPLKNVNVLTCLDDAPQVSMIAWGSHLARGRLLKPDCNGRYDDVLRNVT